jgi:hypothetical protein
MLLNLSSCVHGMDSHGEPAKGLASVPRAAHWGALYLLVVLALLVWAIVHFATGPEQPYRAVTLSVLVPDIPDSIATREVLAGHKRIVEGETVAVLLGIERLEPAGPGRVNAQVAVWHLLEKAGRMYASERELRSRPFEWNISGVRLNGTVVSLW